MTLDAGLIEEVKTGRAVLFLGAGASLGATDKSGNLIPDTDQLGKLICAEFLGPQYAGLDFFNTCDYAITAKSGRELQRFIKETLEPFEPARFHLKIPDFHWAGLATTNFDLIVERAYKAAAHPLQRLKPLIRDVANFMDTLEKGDLLYLKLHGCITAYEQISPGMVFSTQAILRHRDGRAAQFAEFLEWARGKTVLFAGYSISDHNMRQLIDEVIKEGDTRPKHYIIKPNILEFEKQYWAERRFTVVDSTFEAFIDELDAAIPKATRMLAGAKKKESTSLSKFIASNKQESHLLDSYLQTGAEHVSSETAAQAGSAKKFFSGFDLGWYPIEHQLDFSRSLTSTILHEQVVTASTPVSPRLVVLKAHAGAGKSVLLRRVAWDAAKRLNKLVIFVPSNGFVNVQALQELSELTQETIFLIVEDLTLVADGVLDALNGFKKSKHQLIVIGGARFNEWNIRAQSLDAAITSEYELKYLNHREVEDLLVLLELNDCLGELEHLKQDQRVKQFEEVYGRQLLVALHEATRNSQFADVILDEYRKITPPEAQILYADICALNRFGSPVRAGLISRVHGINFEQFQQRFFRPLEQVVALEEDKRSGDWIYRARHPYIAEMLYGQVFVTPEDRFDNHTKLITRLNPAYSYDRRIIGDLLRGSKLAESFPDIAQGIAIYDLALDALGEEAHIYHQMGIYLMKRGHDIKTLGQAEDALKRANEIAPSDRTIRHSLAELALSRSRISVDPIERAAWRGEAIKRAQPLIGSSNGSHAYHTIAKAQTSALNDALDLPNDDALTGDLVSETIKAAEEAIRAGLSHFPGDSHLLSEEARLAELLENDERAERALKRAFDSNKKSQLIAKRYAVVLKARNKLGDAREVLREALEFNPFSQDLNFDFAQLERAIDPGIDANDPEKLLSYFLRSFAKGDKNYRAQLLCARQFALAGKHQEAKAIFDLLKVAPVPFKTRTYVKEEVKLSDGTLRAYNGIVTSRRDSYGFIQLDSNGISCYFNAYSMKDGADLPPVGTRVSQHLGFSFNGPASVDVEVIH